MYIGQIIYSKKYGKLRFRRSEYSNFNNAVINYGMTVDGREVQLDGTETLKAPPQTKRVKESESLQDIASAIKMQKGETGSIGGQGKSGYTPRAGKDYYSKQQISEIINNIARQNYAELKKAVSKLKPNNGMDGADGIDGPIGPGGRDGLDGRDGRDGKDGKNGLGRIPKHKAQDGFVAFENPDGTFGKGFRIGGHTGGQSFTGLAKVNTAGTPGTLEDMIVAGAGIELTVVDGKLVITNTGGSAETYNLTAQNEDDFITQSGDNIIFN